MTEPSSLLLKAVTLEGFLSRHGAGSGAEGAPLTPLSVVIGPNGSMGTPQPQGWWGTEEPQLHPGSRSRSRTTGLVRRLHRPQHPQPLRQRRGDGRPDGLPRLRSGQLRDQHRAVPRRRLDRHRREVHGAPRSALLF